MTRDRRNKGALGAKGAIRGLTVAALLLAGAARAQDAGSVSDYRLPPKGASSPVPVEGPVDTDHPVATPTRSAPDPAPAPTASPAPQIVLPPAAAEPERLQPQRPRTAPEEPIAASPVPTNPTLAGPALAPSPLDSPAAPALEPLPAPSSPPAATAPANEADWWPFLVAGILAALAAAAVLLWIRRRPAAPDEGQVPAADEALAAPAASAPTTLAPVGRATPRQPPNPIHPGGPLAFTFEPQSLRLSFVYATLSYQVTLTSHNSATFNDLRIYGDLASGHSSRPVWQQLSLDGVPLPKMHEVAALFPGETVTLAGEMRIPLADVLPLRAGAATMFAPLARFLIEAERGDGGGYGDTHVFTLGLPSQRRGDTMQPFRLDLGPRLFDQIEQREVDIGRWLQLDEARQAG